MSFAPGACAVPAPHRPRSAHRQCRVMFVSAALPAPAYSSPVRSGHEWITAAFSHRVQLRPTYWPPPFQPKRAVLPYRGITPNGVLSRPATPLPTRAWCSELLGGCSNHRFHRPFAAVGNQEGTESTCCASEGISRIHFYRLRNLAGERSAFLYKSLERPTPAYYPYLLPHDDCVFGTVPVTDCNYAIRGATVINE